YIEFELPVKLSHTSFIDGYIKETRVLIEQKSADIDLRKGQKQSDGAMLTPFQQARRYGGNLPHSQNPRWIVVCNFHTFHIHDMERPNDPPEVLALANLETQYTRLNFLTNVKDKRIQEETEISLQAGEIVRILYDTLLKQYKNPESPETLRSLNALCVRLVFCFYAEDAGVFKKKKRFHDYLDAHRAEDRNALINLFHVLDQEPEERDPYLDDDLKAFPYVNGGLFSDESIEIPRLGDEIIDLILNKAENFNWSRISPPIFGAIFESTLNRETRRSGGMHYTSIENIHKVIDPLFLNDLRAELEQCKNRPVAGGARKRSLQNFQKKLASLTFLDPACGSGNFLTETYRCLRHMENEIISILNEEQIALDMEGMKHSIRVSISQFYGVEINDFAVAVARTALWIAESQMMKETEDVILMDLDFLPLKTAAHIVEGNALRMDWESVAPKHTLNYIISNPPFVGARLMSAAQKNDVNAIFDGWKNAGNLDYVSCWYKKAADLITKTQIRAALVSTNSVTQGESVANLWKPLMENGVHIDFAHRTFRWDSEAEIKAHVHCVIVGFSVYPNDAPKVIYTSGRPETAQNINGYLLDAPNVFIGSRSKPLCNAPIMSLGNQPIDGGYYSFTEEEMEKFLESEPMARKYFRPWVGSKEFINRIPRYFLYLRECDPSDLRKLPECCKRVEAVRQFRLSSNRAVTRQLADTPREFAFTNISKGTYIVVPEVSSEKRRYIPMGFQTPDILCSNLVKIVPNTTLYHFGVLTSNVHNAWTRAVCGRLKSDYRYSNTIVYNNFPWPNPTDAQKAKIEKTAQAILDARALYPKASLADLYDETAMPAALRKAHQNNDRAVMEAYGFSVRDIDESKCVAELMKLYQRLAAQSP
ncbi:MAG: SAM-dependent DNA methyltransferase, partial [Oscillibacter sp.]|nr:SAM-dependent DNA methyltransferase [Oscillibacter sp.]